ncbi:hypothetical protein GE107_17400 [Cohnella sp. CFH 77786]|uniref:PCYCGC domain-containing protein n=1 Tax=Cohnella sp. CFH 77786 TaxID=2662265 RepID=UPI001C60BE08|nr:PCYCGC domain-containing protein [Cohnella sp. CFH 77786]MBW5447832.1 hypothetical protein [Cohnella sp. CFH 77786]
MPAGWRGKLFWLLGGLALLLFLAACGSGSGTDSEGADSGKGALHVHQAPNGDTREETASLDKLPAFLDNRPNKMLLAYQAAAKLRDTLQWIPCYCGCGESAGHKSNLNCFIHEVREDGTVVWDDHGTRCDVCQTIALQAAQMKSQGKSDLEIRKFIDASYKNGYAKPTVTPMPEV